MRTKTADPEMELRHDLAKAMKGLWRLTWHEDREINPGVPDTSFVMLGIHYAGHETGWMELKAIRDPGDKKFKFKIEPSQHQWIRDHHELVPVFFLVAVGDDIFLIDGCNHTRLDESMTKAELARFSKADFKRHEIREYLSELLALYTQRASL